jgi:capsular polysaccharide biosynthesis protein
METQNKQYEIDLLDLLLYLKKKIWLLVAATVLFAVLGAAYTAVFVDDTYTAATRLYVLNRASDSYISSSDYNVSSFMVNDCEVLLTGRNVTDEVIDRLGLDLTSGQLKDMISVSTVGNTRVLQIEVVDTDPQRAADIANCVQQVARNQLKEILNVEAVNLVYEAKVPQQKSGPSLLTNTALAALLGLILCVGVQVVLYTLDDTVRTEADVERYLGLSVLGVIPESLTMGERKKASGSIGKTIRKSAAKLLAARK